MRSADPEGTPVTLGARAWFIAVVAMAMAGCATRPPERIPYNAEARRNIVRIALVEPAPPATFLVSSGAPESLMQGFAGAGIGAPLMLPLVFAAVAVETAMAMTFTRAANDAGFDPGETLAASLAMELERVGFLVTRHRVARAPAATVIDARWLGDYRAWRDSADAVLDVQWLAMGYRAVDPFFPYTPVASAGVRLVDPRDHRILYRDTLSFGLIGYDRSGKLSAFPGNMPTAFVADDHRFPTFLDLSARRDDAFDGLHSAARHVAARVALDLAPP
jgi:hypothetical protein